MHNERTNEITFTDKERKYIFDPLTSSQDLENQIKLK